MTFLYTAACITASLFNAGLVLFALGKVAADSEIRELGKETMGTAALLALAVLVINAAAVAS